MTVDEKNHEVMDLTIILPTYNEKNNINILIKILI